MGQGELLRFIPDAPKALCDILDPIRGPVQTPIRSEIFGAQRLVQHAHSLASTHHTAKSTSRKAIFFPRLENNISTLREAHRYIGVQARTGYDISPAAEWLLDNFHLIEAQLNEIHEGLPRSYYRALPLLQDKPLAGLPRIYGVAWAFIAHTDGAFNETLLSEFLIAYQQTRELGLSELWALPTTLRVVLIENLRRLAERVATNKAAREAANLCFDRVDTYTVDELDCLLALLNARGVGRVFLAQMAQRSQDRRATGEDNEQLMFQNWLSQALPDLATVQIQHGADQAADNLSVSNAVISLRSIGDTDWADIIASTSAFMRLMLTLPVFEAEDAITRDQTLHAVERLSKRSGRSELEVAQTLLDLMQDSTTADITSAVASHWLRGPGRPALVRALGLHDTKAVAWQFACQHLALPAYLGTLVLVAFSVLWILLHHQVGANNIATPGWLTMSGVALLMIFPISEAVVAVINRLISESAKPQHLPRFSLTNGIPPTHRVMVVIPAMLTSKASIRELVCRLQLHYLANPEKQAQYALLTDWMDSDTPRTTSDTPLLALAVEQIHALNLRHPRLLDEAVVAPRFIVLHRERHFCETEQRWIGWERKRGKLELLVAALAQSSSAAFFDLGDESRIAPDIQYILTLDSDTQLPPGRLRELVGVAAHPHNQPQLDASGRSIINGYGIFQPRVATPLPSPQDFTLYHWLFAGQCGNDPYSAASSEVYQDLFHEGTFTGKGLLHVKAIHAVLSGRLPEGQVLSHDLLEGSLARCAAVTDITVVEDAPFHADVAASRVHRWTRGDWQLLPFLFNTQRYRLRAVNRWKMFDNLRRSLVAPMSFGLMISALSGSLIPPWTALTVVMAAIVAGPLMGAVAGFSPSRDDLAKLHFYREAGKDLARALLSGLWLFAQLLQQSIAAIDAIGRALYRLFISHRHLLQWTTAAAAQAQATTSLPAVVRKHAIEPVAAAVIFATLATLGTPNPVLALGLCVLWAASPVWTWWVSRTPPAGKRMALHPEDHAYLEGIARDTWRLFERCVNVSENHLPPDNLQTLPHDMVAHRTSPTNIGLYLLSVACARQFGWIGTQELLLRLEATLATLLTMQRHRGHFLNWYDTQSLAPLLPSYVSTVDSGNLSGHLIALAQACLELSRAPFNAAAAARAISASTTRLKPLLAKRSSLSLEQRTELRWLLADHRATISCATQDVQAHAASDTAGTSGAAAATARLQALAHAYEQLAWEADFSFLFHSKRCLFHIGYRVAEQQRDAGFYDLLASESRLTSLLAIAKGDVPVRHWGALGRQFFAVGADAGLRSWAGSMFEYLMPSLMLNEPLGSVLHEACGAALTEQISFADGQDVPWGISESAYAASDYTLAYQYAPQGVPRLALRRTPSDELVVAPYATALAAQLLPHLASKNFATLESLGARARYGFIEALDFSASRRSPGEAFSPVCTFMAHHQGMSIVALTNVLFGGAVKHWGMANPHLKAVSTLLHERVPREVSLLYASPSDSLPQARERRRAPGLLTEVLPGEAALQPTHILSNGRYSVSLRANGAGWSHWGQTGITRQRDDALRDEYGSFIYLRWDHQPQAVSITQHPAPDPQAHYQSVYHADRVCFDASWTEIETHATVWVSPEDDIEFRQIELRNLSDHTIDIELLSAFEVSLSDPRADEAHPAFTNLFVSAEWFASQEALLFERKPRLPTEHALKIAHFVADKDAQILNMGVTCDRQRWRGRNHAVSQPLASVDTLPQEADDPATALETGLDPVSALAMSLRIAPHAKARVTIATAASDNGGTLHAMIDKYRQRSNVKRASLMSATLTAIRLRALRISVENYSATQMLTTALLLSLARPGPRAVTKEQSSAEACDKRLLWRFGLSGERPIILVTAGVAQGLGMLRALGQSLSLWAWSGIACDLVVINAEPISYLMTLQREMLALAERHGVDCRAQVGPVTTGFYVLRATELSSEEVSTLHVHARLHLNADGRPLSHHIQDWIALHELDFESRHAPSRITVPVTSGAANISMSYGSFETASGEFNFEVGNGVRPTRPWINVLSNPTFGAQLSEAGGGYSWAVNSRMNQLTAWSNDPVADTPSEWFLLQDKKTGQTWSVAPSAWGLERATYRVSHGQGYTTLSHRRGDLEVHASWCVDPQTSVKQVTLQLQNHGHKPLKLRVIGIAEWLMGANRSDRSTVHSTYFRQQLPDHQLTALLCTQRERSAGFGNGTAFFAIADRPNAGDGTDWTCDRRELFDARGRLIVPDHFGQRCGDGLDPCAALSAHISLGAGESQQRVFLLGYAESEESARRLATTALSVPPAQRMAAVREQWNKLLGATVVKTPDPLFDAMVNRWLLYQTVTCRLWAKAGFYQAGGATGFRDQIQDAMALAWTEPDMLRQQIVLCAAHQFPEGDVQHWWHAPTGAGVRTHFSDDLLWLAHACVHYLRATGDDALLDQHVPFLEGAAIPDGAEDAYYTPTISSQEASIYEHAARAIDRSLSVGAHGLPLMGSGDWNDGMNRVGIAGRGESVWLGWFLCQLVADFAPMAYQRGEGERALRWEEAALGWKVALNGVAWDGEWFKRAFFDDGQSLGSHTNPEARIDLIAQAWAVLSKAAPPALQHMAMASVEAHLVDHTAGLIKLLDPPLAFAQPSAGYIQAYPPGVRENGGQYSHAGVWALMAAAKLATSFPDDAASADLAYRYFTYLSPAHRAKHPSHGDRYGLEPYVMAGDVYTQPPYVGRGGWSWYTGAAAWMHRAAIESIFGLRQTHQDLIFTPCLPSHWPQAELTLQRDQRSMRFILIRATAEAALEAANVADAQLLHPGQSLPWCDLPINTCFVIPLASASHT